MNAGMTSQVVIQGIVTGQQWNYSGDTLFRIAHYRGADRRPVYTDKQQQVSDYFTIRIPAGGVPVQVPQAGTHVIIEGYLVDRQEEITLADFGRRARGATKLSEEVIAEHKDLVERRSVTEIVLIRLNELAQNEAAAPSGAGRAHQGPRRGRRQDLPTAPQPASAPTSLTG